MARSRSFIPPPYVLATLVISVGGLLFGLDTGIIGPVTTMASYTDAFGHFSSTIHGVIVSSILIPAAIASFLAGHLADKLGRPQSVMFGAIINAFGAALEAGANSLGMFIGGRVIAGIGEGFFLSTVTVYTCEIAPAKYRGPLASLSQMFTTIGLCAGYFICYGSSNLASSMSWRTPFIVQAILATCLAIACPFLPASPRWLIMKRRIGEVPAVLNRLGLDPSEFAVDADNTRADTEHKESFVAVFRKDARKQTAFAMFLMAMAQFSGIDGVLFYAPLLFQQAGLSSSQASFLASGVSALVIFLVTIPASIWADKWARRTSTIWGGLALAACMTLIGSLYASNSVHPTTGAARWVVVVSIYLFAVAYSITWAVAFKIYASEIQPAGTRAAASSLAQSSNWIANWIVAFTTPIFLAKSAFGAYFLFGSCCLFTVVVAAVFMPETRGKSLEDTHHNFDHSSTEALKTKLGLPKLLRKSVGDQHIELQSRPVVSA